jgi:ferredoxin
MNDETLVADRSLCIGSGLCAMVAPRVFSSAADDLVDIIAAPDRNDAAVARAVAGCPVGALSWTPTPQPRGRSNG